MGIKNGDQKKTQNTKGKKSQTRENMKEKSRIEERWMFNNALVAAKIKLMAQDNVFL